MSREAFVFVGVFLTLVGELIRFFLIKWSLVNLRPDLNLIFARGRTFVKKLFFKLFFVLAVLPSAIFGCLYYLNENGYFNISEIEVVLSEPPVGQEQFLNPFVEETNQLLKKYKGMSLWDIKLSRVNKELKDFEWIESISIKRSFPNTLSVTVVPVEVKLLYLGKNGNLIPIAEEGKILSPVNSKQAPDVVLLDGAEFMKDEDLRKRAVKAIEQIPETGAFSRATISEMRYDKKEGFWMTMVKTGIEVKIGEDQIPIKAVRISKVVDYLETHRFDARVIDANLSKKVLVRLRKDP